MAPDLETALGFDRPPPRPPSKAPAEESAAEAKILIDFDAMVDEVLSSEGDQVEDRPAANGALPIGGPAHDRSANDRPASGGRKPPVSAPLVNASTRSTRDPPVQAPLARQARGPVAMRTPPAGARPLTARSAPAGPVAPSRAAAGRRGRSDGTVYWLALFLAALTLFSAAPALPHWNLIQAPNWARAMLILTALELVYIAWMVTLPDWITVWIGMIVFALVAALYGMALAMALVTPSGRPLMLDLTDVRRGAVGWSAAALLLSAFMVYACGRVAGKWRRAAAT